MNIKLILSLNVQIEKLDIVKIKAIMMLFVDIHERENLSFHIFGILNESLLILIRTNNLMKIVGKGTLSIL